MDSTAPSSTNGKTEESNGKAIETEESNGKKAIAIKGDGDRIQKRSQNSALEDIGINSMIDQVRRRDLNFTLTNSLLPISW